MRSDDAASSARRNNRINGEAHAISLSFES
jgi:hypothetical protein